VTVLDAIDYYQGLPQIEYAEPNYQASAIKNDNPVIDTNDSLYSSQWALENIGQSGGTIDADINGPETWLIETGDTSVVIGVIDSGVDYNHNDLSANLWQNSLEIPGNGIDDDVNGYVDDRYGINAITGTGNPFDDYQHGTHVLGTIGAVGGNILGVTGVMQIANIASCKFLNSTGNGNSSDALECMQYFINLKTRAVSPQNIVAVNNSWVLAAKSQALQDAIVQFRNLGILFVAASGNAGTNNDTASTYPASYPVSNVIAVAATDRNDAVPSFSNYGKMTVHVAAPGVGIVSTLPGQSFGSLSGTSMAAPQVTGLIGLLKSQLPGLTWSQLKNVVIAGGRSLPGLASNTMSSRRIRGADSAGVGSFTCVDQIVKARMEPLLSTLFIAKNSSVSLKALHINCKDPNGNVTLYSGGAVTVTLADAGVNGDEVAGDGVYSLNWTPTIAGTYNLDYGNGDIVTVRVYDPSTWKGYNVAADATFTSETITGTSLGAGDETVSTIVSPFPIKLGGDTIGFSNLYVSSNGAISLTDNVLISLTNRPFPIASPATVIAPFWDDLTFSVAGANIYYQVLGSAPNRKLVVEWRQFRNYSSNPLLWGTFQVIFYENSSNIRMSYKDTDLGSATYNFGKSATVGLQLSGSLYTQYSYLLPNVPSNRSLLYTLKP
jgi:subtilisin family serine protease